MFLTPEKLLIIMKILPLLLITAIPLPAATITQWNFNSVPNDATLTTGTTSPSTGVGTASPLTTTATISTGSNNGGSSDSNTTDNTAWNTTTYPTATVGDLSAGVQFLVDTRGYDNIMLTYDLRHSNSSSRYEAVQYTINGTSWTTASFFTAAAGDTWYNGRSVSLSGISQVANNQNFGVRIVSAFESTATGAGPANYVASTTGTNYAASGTWRFDMVTVSGSAIPEPTAALLGSIGLLGLLRRRR